MPKKYNWTEIDSLAEYLTADEIVKYLHLGRISAKTRARIEDLITRKKLTLKLNASKTLKSKAIQGNLSALKKFAQPEEQQDEPEIGIPQAEYARQKGISRSAVFQAIRAGTLGWNGKTGRACRVWELAEEKTDLLTTRIEKMKTETALKRQQIDANRKNNFREMCGIFTEALKTAYAPLTAKLVNLRLSKEQIAELTNIAQGCEQTFERLMNEYTESYLETGAVRAE